MCLNKSNEAGNNGEEQEIYSVSPNCKVEWGPGTPKSIFRGQNELQEELGQGAMEIYN